MPAETAGIGRWLRRRAENVAVALLVVVFVTIVVQVTFRYVVNFPLGWTDELTLAAWVWLVLWGAAFVVRDREEIRFELLLGGAPPRVRRAMTVAAALALVGVFAMSLPATWDYVTFMKVQSTAYLHIRFDWLFSVYILFAVAAIVRHLWIGWRAVMGREEPPDPTHPGSGP